MKIFPLDKIKELRKELAEHPVYDAVKDLDDLSIFMQHHVYSVWDFMSLVKYLQHKIAPTATPWIPQGDPQVRRFINDIVLEEESDIGLPLADGTVSYISHFELYLLAMEEVKVGTATPINSFIKELQETSVSEALNGVNTPLDAQKFVQHTFEFIASDKPHVIAAAFALGREHIIPEMFRALLKKMNIDKEEATAFYYYLERHIELDTDHHGPLSLRMLELLCDNDPKKIAEAEEAAIKAIKIRIKFWDGVLDAIKNKCV